MHVHPTAHALTHSRSHTHTHTRTRNETHLVLHSQAHGQVLPSMRQARRPGWQAAPPGALRRGRALLQGERVAEEHLGACAVVWVCQAWLAALGQSLQALAYR